MTEIRITSIPLMQMLQESIEITIYSLMIQNTIESDDNKKLQLVKRITEYQDLADKFQAIIEQSKKDG